LVFVWFRIFSYLAPYITFLNIIIGGLALLGGVYFLRQFFKFIKQGPTCDIKQTKIIAVASEKLERAFKEKKNVLALLGAVILFAAIVTVIEFPCSAVFPVVFTGMLAEAEVSLAMGIFYILVYLLLYMLIPIVLFLVAVIMKKILSTSRIFMCSITLLASLVLFYLSYSYFFMLII